MEEKLAEAGHAGRGRPRSFDPDVVIDAALALFWARGYDATKFEDVTAVTGVNASSLYAAFGNKRGLFQAAMDRYRTLVGRALEVLVAGDEGVADVARFVEWVRAGIVSDEQPSGCLVVNTMVELASTDTELAAVVRQYREDVRNSLRTALARAEDAGEIEPGTGDQRALLVQASLFGALVTGRSGAIDEADSMLRSLLDEVRGWHTAR